MDDRSLGMQTLTATSRSPPEATLAKTLQLAHNQTLDWSRFHAVSVGQPILKR